MQPLLGNDRAGEAERHQRAAEQQQVEEQLRRGQGTKRPVANILSDSITAPPEGEVVGDSSCEAIAKVNVRSIQSINRPGWAGQTRSPPNANKGAAICSAYAAAVGQNLSG